ncbi:DUF952 domain-containing protein [Luteimonas yanweni]
MTPLFRVTALANWREASSTGVLPRCAADRRDDCVHLNAGEDVERVASAFFVPSEEPVALELDTAALSQFVTWLPPSAGKPWPQARLQLPNILASHVLSVRPLSLAPADSGVTFGLPSGAA